MRVQFLPDALIIEKSFLHRLHELYPTNSNTGNQLENRLTIIIDVGRRLSDELFDELIIDSYLQLIDDINVKYLGIDENIYKKLKR